MTTITIYLDPETEARLRQISTDLDRKVEDLAETAIAETALAYFRDNEPGRDPARKIREAAR